MTGVGAKETGAPTGVTVERGLVTVTDRGGGKATGTAEIERGLVNTGFGGGKATADGKT